MGPGSALAPRLFPFGALISSACLLCASVFAIPAASAQDTTLSVVATTPILGDFAQNVGGDHVAVTTLLHSETEALSYDPSLRDMTRISAADVVLTHHLNLEPEPLMHALESALKPKAQLVRVAEHIPAYDGDMIPLVEDAALDTAWLGFNVQESTQPVTLRMTHSSGPGEVTAFITGALGEPHRALQFPGDASFRLAAGSHTHLNWAFTAPGEYRVELQATSPDGTINERSSLRFIVGTNPAGSQVPIIDHGHWDITVRTPTHTSRTPAGHKHSRKAPTTLSAQHSDAAKRGVAKEALALVGEDSTGDHSEVPLDQATIAVPPAALMDIPKDKHFDFLRRNPAQKNSPEHHEVYMLAQAVVGRHRHGDVDPHVWLNPHNAQAAAMVIAAALSRADPTHSDEYARNARSYYTRIETTSQNVQAELRKIPDERRFLISDYDALRYFAEFYDFTVAGLIGKHPNDQPSTRQLVTVSTAIASLNLPAVFLDAATTAASSGAGTADLRAIASDRGVDTCSLYLSSFDPAAGVRDYLSLLTTTAHTVSNCLIKE